MKPAYLIALAFVASSPGTGQAQGARLQKNDATAGVEKMDITRKADMKTIDGPADYFTGKVTITGQFQREEPSRMSGAIVHFEPSARTAWHKHPRGRH